MRWLPESRVLRVLVTPVLQCTSQMFLHWCHIRHSEAVSPSLGHVQTVFSEFKACVGNVMLLKRGQQVLLCRYPAYAQMVRVPRAALWILLCWSNDYWQKELYVKLYTKCSDLIEKWRINDHAGLLAGNHAWIQVHYWNLLVTDPRFEDPSIAV